MLRLTRILLSIATLVAVLALPAAAIALPPRVPIHAAPAPGPARYDRQWIRRYGPASAKTVLVLAPGSPSGQSNFDLIAPELVARVPGLQIWTVDRRSNAFEDPTGFETGNPETALGYYAGLSEVNGRSFHPRSDARSRFVRGWGAKVALDDLRTVVLRASDHGRRRVLLGGHSEGGVLTMAYAVWDFDGHPGYRDVDGLVFIDGALMGAFERLLRGTIGQPVHTVAAARRLKAKLARRTPFGSFSGFAEVPAYVTGLLPELGCQYALAEPNAPSTLQSLLSLAGSLIPAGILPPDPVTNAGLMSYLFTHGPDSFHIRVESGDADLASVCGTFTTEPGNGMEWYFPTRIETDTLAGMESLRRTPVTDYMKLRPWHLRDVNVPVYAFETSLSQGGLLPAVRRFARASQVPTPTLAGDHDMGHLDPLMDLPEHNRFITTVTPFLQRLTR
jgi:hypothetical protein